VLEEVLVVNNGTRRSVITANFEDKGIVQFHRGLHPNGLTASLTAGQNYGKTVSVAICLTRRSLVNHVSWAMICVFFFSAEAAERMHEEGAERRQV
jgi:hypothetical protein